MEQLVWSACCSPIRMSLTGIFTRAILLSTYGTRLIRVIILIATNVRTVSELTTRLWGVKCSVITTLVRRACVRFWRVYPTEIIR